MPRKIPKAVLFVMLALLVGCAQSAGAAAVIKKADGTELRVQIEVADTEAKREKGLMFRQNVPEGSGMLFLFPRETRTPFWMKNTPSPLDMIFIREGRVVSVIENAVPYSENLLIPEASYTEVLEVTGGYVSRHGIHLQDGVTVEGASRKAP